jgi:hypothetical protein
MKKHQVIDDQGFTRTINKGSPKVDFPLPALFDQCEWEKLSRFNKTTSAEVHIARLPTTANGKSFIILPSNQFSDEMIDFLRTIGVKGKLFISKFGLEVKMKLCF